MYPIRSAYKAQLRQSLLRENWSPWIQQYPIIFSAVAPTRADSSLPSTPGSNSKPSDTLVISPSVSPTSVHSRESGLRATASASTGHYPTSSAAPDVSGSLGSFFRMQSYSAPLRQLLPCATAGHFQFYILIFQPWPPLKRRVRYHQPPDLTTAPRIPL